MAGTGELASESVPACVRSVLRLIRCVRAAGQQETAVHISSEDRCFMAFGAWPQSSPGVGVVSVSVVFFYMMSVYLLVTLQSHTRPQVFQKHLKN